MAKRKKRLSNKEKEIRDLIEELKKEADATKLKEIEELEGMLNGLFIERSLPKRILIFTISFLFHFVIMYIISLICVGFFMEALVLENRALIFLICLFTSFILTLYEVIPRNPFARHFILKNTVIFALVLFALFMINKDIYPIFKFSSIWIIYVIFIEVMYNIFDYTISKKFLGM